MPPEARAALSPGTPIHVAGDDGMVVDAVVAHGGEPTTTPADATVAVAVGREAFVAIASAVPSVPILPVALGPGVRSVAPAAIDGAVARLFADDWTTVSNPIVTVEAGGDRWRSVLDVAVVVDEPGRISEFAVRSNGAHVGTIRADGIVTALPAGSADYARAAGGPVLGPETAVAAVVPIAPYAVDPDHWVLSLTNLQLSLERVETPVVLVVDGESVGRVAVGEPVVIDRTGTVRTVDVSSGLETP